MNCKISCSFGEIVDKVTILNIKSRKAQDEKALENIKKELSIIKKENPMVEKKDELFVKLSNVNQGLWDLEDNIREKSRKKEFDQQYIFYAEQIHIQNDKRYKIKRQINEKYNSALKEEKVYKLIGNDDKIMTVDSNDIRKLEIGKKLYTDGHYEESMSCIKKIMNKYKNYDKFDSFFVDLLFSYSNICSIFNVTYPYFDNIKNIMLNIEHINISGEQKIFCKKIYASLCLHMKLYRESYDFINYINDIVGPNVSAENMSFFKEGVGGKTLLIYDGGGLGDKFMFSRFIPKLCETYKMNKIVFLVPDCLVWCFKEMFKNLNNIKIVSDKYPQFIGHFDYHCSLLALLKNLNVTYNTLYLPSIYKNINVDVSEECGKIIRSFGKKTYILNWKGNPDNPHEKNNRMMNLVNAIPLFKLNDIHLVVIAKQVNSSERKLLKKYNVEYIGNKIDKDKAFYDTVSILRNVEGVISTDTSLPHLSLSLGVKTYVLLTLGCEWRWTKDVNTNWYPAAVLMRQSELGDWKYPVQQLVELLKK